MNGKRILQKRQDRLMAFFDAVMAIAMTVLALEITVPPLSAISSSEKYTFFVSLTCYLISFVAMSTLWYIHNNFFSSHDLPGNNMGIVVHLILLFVITLFQPLTRAIGQYPDDPWIRTFYLLDFFVMYGLLAMIIIYIRKRENKINTIKTERLSFVKEKRESNQEKAEDTSSEAKELRRLLQIVYAIENPEELRKKMAEYMPDEYQQELKDLKSKREASYRMSLYAVVIMACAVLAAVITLIFSIWWSYVCLGAGLIAIFLLRIHAQPDTSSN